MQHPLTEVSVAWLGRPLAPSRLRARRPAGRSCDPGQAVCYLCKTLGCSQITVILPPENGEMNQIDRNCMLACDVCGHCPCLLWCHPFWEGHPSTSCCSAFHSSIVQVRRLRGEGTRRSVAGHGPVYSLTVCLKHLPTPCETVMCVSSGSIADRWRVVKRSSLFPALAPPITPCLQLAGLSDAETTYSLAGPWKGPKNSYEWTRLWEGMIPEEATWAWHTTAHPRDRSTQSEKIRWLSFRWYHYS